MALFDCHVDREDVIFEKNFKLKYLSIEDCAEHPNDNFEILPNLAVSCQNLEKLSVNRCRKKDSFEVHPLIVKCIVQNSGTLGNPLRGFS